MSCVLVLAPGNDRGAWSVAAGLVDRLGCDRVAVVTGDQLAAATWLHSIEGGRAASTVRLPSGGVIVPERFGAVLNRLPALSAFAFGPASAADRLYADAELQALFVSFLAGFGNRVCNAMDGQGMMGQWHPLQWRALAQRCGLVAAPLHLATSPGPTVGAAADGGQPDPDRTVLVAGRYVVGARTSREEAACRHLARMARCDVIEVSFTGASPAVTGVDVLPALVGPQVDAVTAMLCDRLLDPARQEVAVK